MASLLRELSRYTANGMCSFHTPGHKGRNDLLSAIAFPEHDLTELPGLDMLHNPQGVIAETQKSAAVIYGADETYFLVNGATSGNQAMFVSLMPYLNGKKIRIERKAHRSVIGALIISGLIPEYIAPTIHPDFNLPLGLEVKQFVGSLENTGALHLTSPSYYGTVLDLESIIAYRDRSAPALPILIDQAHGSHFKGSLFPCNAVAQGADLVVHSTHKTMSALTQGAMLHVQGNRIDRISVKKALEFLLTSSPNYMLMASLEKAVLDLEKPEVWDDLYEEVIHLHESLDGPLRILTAKDAGYYGIKDVDWSKILVNISSLEIDTSEAVRILRTTFKIEPELWDDQNILFMLGIGNLPQEVRFLRKALESLTKRYRIKDSSVGRKRKTKPLADNTLKAGLPPMRMNPRDAWLAPKKMVKVKEAFGRIAGETISVYPPGIPLVAAGEEITLEILEFLNRAEEYNWQGWQGLERGEILVADV